MPKRINVILEKGFRYLEFFIFEYLYSNTFEYFMLKKFRDTASRIQTIVSKYADTDVFVYLRGVAQNFQLQADS